MGLGRAADRDGNQIDDTVRVIDPHTGFDGSVPLVDPGADSPVYAALIEKPPRPKTSGELQDVFRFQMAKGDPKAWYKVLFLRFSMIALIVGATFGGYAWGSNTKCRQLIEKWHTDPSTDQFHLLDQKAHRDMSRALESDGNG